MEKAKDRLDVLKKIEEYEKAEKWDVDVEEDPPAKELKPEDIDYLNQKISSKLATFFANKAGQSFFEKMIKNGKLRIKKIHGLENFEKIKGRGAILTCNHFNVYDNYIVWKAIKKSMGKKPLYKVIREGNYTNSPPPFGFILRHCNTLPLSSNSETMKKFLKSLNILLKRGEKVLIYPEQAMWWNYRKPRPFKDGAFKIAVENKVPILPIFITMQDSDTLDDNGFYIQEHTVWILPPICANEKLSKKENVAFMRDENFRMWKNVYEKFYNK